MANTGFKQLRYSGELERDAVDARKFALHAQPILEGAHKAEDLNELMGGLEIVFGFTPRNPRPDGRGLSLDGFHDAYEQARRAGKSVGLLFGNEAHGLQNDQLARVAYRVALPTNSDYASMNLAQAVLVVLWELARHQEGKLNKKSEPDPELATSEDKSQLLANVREFLEVFEFLNPQNPEQIWTEIQPLFNSRDWNLRELNLLNGIFGKAQSRYVSAQTKLTKLGSPKVLKKTLDPQSARIAT